MNILGLSGAFSKPGKDFLPEVPIWLFHDSTAALLIDGKKRFVVEEERLNREKHTNKFALNAIQDCLSRAGISFNEIDKIVYNNLENFVDQCLLEQYLRFPNIKIRSAREFFIEFFQTNFDPNFDPNKLFFVKHHLTHAYSAYFDSGFKDCLVCVIDGQGEKESFSIHEVKNGNFQVLREFSNLDSLGNFYVEAIRFLAYYFFDEYKVMGLAPYGNPEIYRPLFSRLYELLPEGEFKLKRNKMRTFLESGFLPRRKEEPFTQNHKDFAASLQEMLENVVLHVLSYWQEKTMHKNLCLSGGVAHNCTLNGILAYSGLFNNIFVHPASNDAGSALGAAIYLAHQEKDIQQSGAISHVYWGPDIGEAEHIEATLNNWSPFVSYTKKSNICLETALLLAEGKVVGWMQGQMEFGPRALGNRSILADPRPKENKDRINEMVKKREGYRPFAPSVIEERVEKYFELPCAKINLDFMVFNLRVKERAQSLLGATTHVNGTSRVQTVSKDTNLKYWNVIKEFENISGTAVLLNTSFNNMAEPIVSSVQDGVACFLTTGLDYLVIGDYMVSKSPNIKQNLSNLDISITASAVLRCEQTTSLEEMHEIYFHYNPSYNKLISKNMYEYLSCLSSGNSYSLPFELMEEIYYLWVHRFLVIKPPPDNLSTSDRLYLQATATSVRKP